MTRRGLAMTTRRGHSGADSVPFSAQVSHVWVLRLRRFDRDVGLVLATFIILIALENLAVGVGYRAQFVGTWEMGSARLFLSPIALAVTIPLAIASVALGRLARAERTWAVAFVGALFGLGVGLGLSTGRRMASLALRAPFVVLLVLVAGIASWLAARWASRARPTAIAGAGMVLACVAWLVDAFVLRRLYPPFHVALFFLAALGWSGLAGLLRRSPAGTPIAFTGIVLGGLCLAWAPSAAVRVRGEDNLRRILLEHAPILGHSVRLAARMAPPAPIEEDSAASATLTSLRDRPRSHALDWRGHDLVVVTIDALRADHVGAYGYKRPTTPNIDALAAAGARFDHAYCPTPHTSYSVASMMTGKYMKPLLALDTEDDSETWPVQLRRYGYRTAAFYPPAIFFIDEHRFRTLREESLGFEYAKEEFAGPDLRKAQIERYLTSAPRDKPLFLWVHVFEPHEPYEMHPDHPFSGNPAVDAYDSEIAAADSLVGHVVALVTAHRPPGAVFVVSADHGEEHGDHGGRYHGTTVYEEQVRVPLVVVGPGISPRVVSAPVQTIDLLPTSLAALDVPVPPRLRGRDLGPAIAGLEAPTEEGLAFAETDEYTMLARGPDRLVCARKIGSCSLFDVVKDPGELQAIPDRPARIDELKKLTAALERETGRLEAAGLPDALRRALQGDRDAAEDILPLFDDARVDIRRSAARCAFKLKAPEMVTQLRHSFARDEDGEVRMWASLALARLGDPSITPASLEPILRSTDSEQRTAAALALAEHGDARGELDLVARWAAAFTPNPREPGEFAEAREILAAFAKLKARSASPALVRSLDDVRLRPHIVETLGEIGDYRAKEPLLRVFAEERYLHLRPLEARTLVRLGAREKLYTPLVRFAGTPEPMTEAVKVARDARILTPERGGKEWVPAGRAGKGATPPESVDGRVKLTKAGPSRLLVLGGGAGPLTGSVNGTPVAAAGGPGPGNVYVLEPGDLPAGDTHLVLASPTGIIAAWVVPHTAEIPPPPPKAWTPSAPPPPEPPLPGGADPGPGAEEPETSDGGL